MSSLLLPLGVSPVWKRLTTLEEQSGAQGWAQGREDWKQGSDLDGWYPTSMIPFHNGHAARSSFSSLPYNWPMRGVSVPQQDVTEVRGAISRLRFPGHPLDFFSS